MAKKFRGSRGEEVNLDNEAEMKLVDPPEFEINGKNGKATGLGEYTRDSEER